MSIDERDQLGKVNWLENEWDRNSDTNNQNTSLVHVIEVISTSDKTDKKVLWRWSTKHDFIIEMKPGLGLDKGIGRTPD